jgi:hypothetical protein
MGGRWCAVTVIEESGRRRSVDVLASSSFDAAHIFVTHVKAAPRQRHPSTRLSLESVLEIVVDGKIHRVEGKTLQQRILKRRRNVKAGEEFSFRGALRWRTFLLSAMACGC